MERGCFCDPKIAVLCEEKLDWQLITDDIPTFPALFSRLYNRA